MTSVSGRSVWPASCLYWHIYQTLQHIVPRHVTHQSSKMDDFSVVTTSGGFNHSNKVLPFPKTFIRWKMLSNSCVCFEMCIKRYLAVHILGTQIQHSESLPEPFLKTHNK